MSRSGSGSSSGSSSAIVAFGAVSAMGEGKDAVSAGVVGQPAGLCIRTDDELTRAGLARPFAARVLLSSRDAEVDAGDRATEILLTAARGCVRELELALPGWRSLRVGLAVGTSSGGMRTAERAFARDLTSLPVEARRQLAAGAFYFAPLLALVRELDLSFEPATLVMGACAASTIALGIGHRWLASGACDLVLAGGFDAVATLVASGFEVLRATTATLPPRPFRTGRDGMALGEGAALVALRPSHLAPQARVHVTGFGASCDAVHLTAPDRTGAGLASAASTALREAGLARVDLVSPHGSATPFSDAAEARALRVAMPDAADEVVLHPFKAQVGHTLGASGVLETLTCVDALARGILPASAGEGALDPDAPARLLPLTVAASPSSALKLSAAFGGANAALVLSTEPLAAPGSKGNGARPVFVRRACHIATPPVPADLATRIGWPIDRVVRADVLTRCVLAGVAAMVDRDGPLAPAGIIVGTTFATLETDASFFARIQQRGPRMAEPRKFPYTSPNAAAGDAGVAFGLTGPGFSLGAGAHAALEALVVACQLVAAGDADTMVVVGADEIGAVASGLRDAVDMTGTTGAVCVVVSASRENAAFEVVSARCGVGLPAPSEGAIAGDGEAARGGHEALLPLVEAGTSGSRSLEARSPDPLGRTLQSMGWARVDLRSIDEGDRGP